MHYDPIKRSLGSFFNSTPSLRILFYKLLDILLLRSWHIRKALRIWAKARGGKQADALDAGSGFGQYSYRLASLCNGGTVTGVDVKEEQIADCNGFFAKLGLADKVKFEEADLTTFARPESYDLILSVDVMEHIEADEAVFANFHASLRSGGMLLISTPSDKGGSDADEHDHHEGEVHGFIDEHVRDGYNIDDIDAKLRRAGFSRVEAAYSYGTPGHISWVLSMKWPISLLNVTKAFFIILPFYYVLTFPFCLILNCADVARSHKSGTGLIVKAFK